MIRLTPFEWEELKDHLLSRGDIWVEDPETPGRWIRTDEHGAALMVLLVAVGQEAVGLTPMPLEWDTEVTEAYLASLLLTWTTYGHRRTFEDVLREALVLDNEEVEHLAWVLATRPVPEPTGADALPPLVDPHTRDIGFYRLAAGGFVHLRFDGAFIRAELSVPSLRGGYGSLLTGILRRHNKLPRDTAADILGELPERRVAE